MATKTTIITSAVHISAVDGHNEALPVIYRAIGRKSIPFSDLLMVHVDAHPDLLIPDMDPKDCFSKDKLFESVHIETWMTPAVYAGHVSAIVWLKPPWSTQMNATAKDRPHQLTLGSDNKTNTIKTSLMLHYFLNEGCCCSQERLAHQQDCELYVSTVHPSQCNHGNLDSSDSRLTYSDSEGCSVTKKLKLDPCDPTFDLDLNSILERHKAWILDIDLDFFSTANPFKKSFSQEQFDALKALYSYPPYPIDSPNEEDLLRWQEKHSSYLSEVKLFWEDKLSKEDMVQRFPHLADHFLRPAVEEIKTALCTAKKKNDFEDEFDVDFVHTAGLTSDLPEHLSTQDDVDGLIESLKRALRGVTAPPSLVTIARSSYDKYTPVDQVDAIQDKVISALTSVYKNVTLTRLY
jgi:hypothetical protein